MELCGHVKNQTKDSIVFWFSQRDKFKDLQTFNPADLLGKFDLINERPQKWCKLTESLLNPEWLNTAGITSEYLPKLIKKSADIIKRHKSGAPCQKATEKPSNCNNLCIQVTDEVINMRGKNSSNWSHLIPAITRFKNYNSTVALRVWGYALYAAHRWWDLEKQRVALAPPSIVSTAKQF